MLLQASGVLESGLSSLRALLCEPGARSQKEELCSAVGQ